MVVVDERGVTAGFSELPDAIANASQAAAQQRRARLARRRADPNRAEAYM
jgi:hypothetical protein